jgi:chromosomal replication initiation ATPase DnaA
MLLKIAEGRGSARRLPFHELRSDPELHLLLRIVARECGVGLSQILCRSRAKSVTRARHIGVYLAHVELSRRVDGVARLFGRTRSTISHAVQAMEDGRDDRAFDAFITDIEMKFRSRRPQPQVLDHAA